MSLTANDITAKNFKKFYNELLPYLGSYDKGKLTFVGEVKAFFAETAPNGFLICDGATYNKADYPQLANLLLSLTDHSAYEVSGDDTKFKVPDLRGEFLRGSGTNSHTNQGNGAGVGVHQDGTIINNVIGTNNTNGVVWYDNLYESNYNCDSTIGSDSSNTGTVTTAKGNTGRTDINHTSRPTNTSVLYCIAYKDTMVDLDFLSYGGERFAKSDMYDTNERVIGKWIDGKPLYQKVISDNVTSNQMHITFDSSIELLFVDGYIEQNIGSSMQRYPIDSCRGNTPSSEYIQATIQPYNEILINFGSSTLATDPKYIFIIQYTKTTDTADSFKYSTPTDYSTEEKIVGTWIDGKPLYQRTFTKTNISVSANTTTLVTLSSGSAAANCNYKMAIGNRDNSEDIPATESGYYANPVIRNNEFCVKIDRAGIAFTINSIEVTFQYTKTTD